MLGQTMTEQTISPPADAIDSEAILRLIQDKPLTVSQLLEKLPPLAAIARTKWEKSVKATLEEMRREGRLFAHPSLSGRPRYWSHDEKELARQTVQKVL